MKTYPLVFFSLFFVPLLSTAQITHASERLEQPPIQVNEVLQTFLSSVHARMKLQDFVYPASTEIEEIKNENNVNLNHYVYDLNNCPVTVSAFREHVRHITIPVENDACTFDIAPFAEVPVKTFIPTSTLTAQIIHASIIDNSTRNYHLRVKQENDQFVFSNAWERDFVGVMVTATFKIDENSTTGQQYKILEGKLKEEIDVVENHTIAELFTDDKESTIAYEEVDNLKTIEIRKSIFNLVANEKITAIQIFAVSEWCGVAINGKLKRRTQYYKEHGIELEK